MDSYLRWASFLPPRSLEEALHAELEVNWKGTSIEPPASTVKNNANVISSNVVYKIKDGDDGQIKLEGRLALRGNWDKDHFAVRQDSASAGLSVVRLLISLALNLDFDVTTAGVKGAYMQSGQTKLELYVWSFKHVALCNIL